LFALLIQQSKQTPLNSDGQQFTPISTKQTIISKKSWSIIPPISANEPSPVNSDGQQFTPILTKQTITSKQWFC
jgi:hypothetical protein